MRRLVAVGCLWLAMALSSLLAPDLISDAQDHVPVVALTIWIWGAVATGFVLFGAAFPARDGVRVPGGGLVGGVGAARLSGRPRRAGLVSSSEGVAAPTPAPDPTPFG